MLPNAHWCFVRRLAWNNLGPEGAKALAPGLAANASLTECKLCSNNLRVEGWTIIFNALRDSPSSKITTWDLYNEGLGPEIAKALAEYISVSASLTKILVGGNGLGDEGTTILCDALSESTVSKVEELNLYRNQIGPDGARAIAALCAVRPSLTVVNVLRNNLDVASAEMLTAVAKEKVISLCGIKRDQTEANFRNSGLEPCDAIHAMRRLPWSVAVPLMMTLRMVNGGDGEVQRFRAAGDRITQV